MTSTTGELHFSQDRCHLEAGNHALNRHKHSSYGSTLHRRTSFATNCSGRSIVPSWHPTTFSWQPVLYIIDWSWDCGNHRETAIAACLRTKGVDANLLNLLSVHRAPLVGRMKRTRREVDYLTGPLPACLLKDRHEQSPSAVNNPIG